MAQKACELRCVYQPTLCLPAYIVFASLHVFVCLSEGRLKFVPGKAQLGQAQLCAVCMTMAHLADTVTVMAGDGWMAGDGTAMTRQHSSWHDFVTLHSYKKRRIAKNLRVAPWHHFGTGLPCYFFITYYPLEERHLLQWPTHEPDVQSLMGQIQQICDTEWVAVLYSWQCWPESSATCVCYYGENIHACRSSDCNCMYT